MGAKELPLSSVLKNYLAGGVGGTATLLIMSINYISKINVEKGLILDP